MSVSMAKSRDVVEKLRNPKTKMIVITKLDTEEILRLKTRYAFIQRKEVLCELISKIDRKNESFSPINPGSDDEFEDEGRSSLQSAVTRPRPKTAENINMGDYEMRVKPSYNYWYAPDGRNLAEKITYYRMHKYLKAKEDITHVEPIQETVLAEPQPEPKSEPKLEPKKEPVREPTPPPPTPAPPIVPIAPIPIKSDPVKEKSLDLPPETKKDEPQKRPKSAAAEKSPRLVKSAVVYENKAYEEEPISPPPPAKEFLPDETKKVTKEVSDVNIQAVEVKKQEIEEKSVVVEEKVEEIKEQEEAKKADEPKANDAAPKKEKKYKRTVEEVTRVKRKMDEPEQNALISQIDKRIERDLKALQGLDDGDDDGGDMADDDTLDSILHGEKSKELDEFLKMR